MITEVFFCRLLTTILLNFTSVMERMDEQILPAVYSEIGSAFNATPLQLGYLTLSRALVQAFSSPLGGIAGIAIFSLNSFSTFI